MVMTVGTGESVFGEYDEAYGAALESRNLYLRSQLPEILKNSATTVPVQKKVNE